MKKANFEKIEPVEGSSFYMTHNKAPLLCHLDFWHFHPEFEKQIAYVRAHPEVRDVLLSGGDPLLLSDDKLEYLLGQLRSIPHVEFLRIGTRIPIFLPQRITPALCAMLKKYYPLFISVHTVEAHLSRVYRKLGIRSRTELAGRLSVSTTDEPAKV